VTPFQIFFLNIINVAKDMPLKVYVKLSDLFIKKTSANGGIFEVYFNLSVKINNLLFYKKNTLTSFKI